MLCFCFAFFLYFSKLKLGPDAQIVELLGVLTTKYFKQLFLLKTTHCNEMERQRNLFIFFLIDVGAQLYTELTFFPGWSTWTYSLFGGEWVFSSLVKCDQSNTHPHQPLGCFPALLRIYSQPPCDYRMYYDHLLWLGIFFFDNLCFYFFKKMWSVFLFCELPRAICLKWKEKKWIVVIKKSWWATELYKNPWLW